VYVTIGSGVDRLLDKGGGVLDCDAVFEGGLVDVNSKREHVFDACVQQG